MFLGRMACAQAPKAHVCATSVYLRFCRFLLILGDKIKAVCVWITELVIKEKTKGTSAAARELHISIEAHAALEHDRFCYWERKGSGESAVTFLALYLPLSAGPPRGVSGTFPPFPSWFPAVNCQCVALSFPLGFWSITDFEPMNLPFILCFAW